MDQLCRVLPFTTRHSESYWHVRAAQPGTTAVMWRNPGYNDLTDADQWGIIERYLPAGRDAALDVGCGIGRLARRLAARFHSYSGFDLQPMVERAAGLYPELSPCFVSGAVSSFDYGESRWDCIVVVGCLSSACTDDEVPAVLANMAQGLKGGGRLIMLEPFHANRFLRRKCRITAGEIATLARECGLELLHRDGLQFWPVRMLLARPQFERWPRVTRAVYHAGECVCRLAPNLLSDYKVLVWERERQQ